MNIKNLLKFSMLSYVLVSGISGNINAKTHHAVNYKAFQHEVLINDRKTTYYCYKVPQRKLYREDSNTGLLVDSDFGSPLYKACTDDHDEYNYL